MLSNRRLAGQIVTACLLTLLPIAMIAMNGTRTLFAILTPVENAPSKVAEVAVARPAIPTRTAPLKFGVYDPAGEFAADKMLAVRHVYVSWADFDKAKLATDLRQLEQQGYQPLLTIEPWPRADLQSPLLPDIEAGKYDAIIDDLTHILNELQRPVLISWGHEMDQDLSKRYPWSGADPERYVAAYRYVVDKMRRQVKTPLQWVWAGVLKEGSLRYWPGEKYADFVGMPIYSFPHWDQQTYGFIREFKTTFEEKRSIVAELKKPLIITELGVSGSSDFQNYWLRQTFFVFDDYPDLAMVVFFYAADTEGAWGANIKTPDWRVHPDAIRGLVNFKLK